MPHCGNLISSKYTPLQVLHQNPGGYLQQRKHLIALVLHYAGMLRMSQEVAHTAAALMDRVVMSGVHMTEQFQSLFVCACLRLAAIQEQAPVPSPAAVTQLTDYSGACSLPRPTTSDDLRWAVMLGQAQSPLPLPSIMQHSGALEQTLYEVQGFQ